MKRLLIFVIGVNLGVNALAEPIVVADYGGVDTGLGIPDLRSLTVPDNIPVNRISITPTFPVVSAMRPGVVQRRVHGFPVESPIFIVGADEDSMRWLEANYDVLASIDALGFVTNIESSAPLSRMQRSFPALEFSVIPIDDIADQYALSFYPVLIDHKEILQ